jgi:hypothetical protein
MSWVHLPQEIGRMILDTLTEDKSCKLASAAALLREWQVVIEPHAFAHIRLTPLRIAELNSMTQRSRPLVHSLCFCRELKRHACTKCAFDNPGIGETSCEENELISEAFRSLFSALSIWAPKETSRSISDYSRPATRIYIQVLDL